MSENLNNSSLTFSISYSDDVNSEGYVSQFLQLCNDNQLKWSSQQLNNPNYSKTNYDAFTLTKAEIQQKEQIQQVCKTKSSFHNFQKHLVTTLKHNIKMDNIKFSQDTKGVQFILWDFFMKSQKLTRTLIHLIYDNNIKSNIFNKKYGLNKILKIYPSSIIKRAQVNLRLETLRQISNMNLKWELDNRRIKNKQQFRVYYQAFVEELKDGGFNKRIPKSKRIKAQQQVNQINKNQDSLA